MVALVAHSGGLMIQDISRAVAHDGPFRSDALRIATGFCFLPISRVEVKIL